MIAATKVVSISAAVALVMAAAWLLWPVALGGGTTYVTTHGISMEPRFHTGDLAILRAADTYAVGDVVAYSSVSLHTTVMHRIVAMDGDRFVIEGDNNTWLDQDHPSQDKVLGKLFLRIPKGGKVLGVLTSPGMLVALGGAALTLVGAVRRPRSRHGARSARRRPALPAPSFSMPTRAVARQVALGSAAVALTAAIGGGVLVTMPSTEHASSTLQVTQHGQFSYTGTAQPGTTYPDGTIATGDTVWTKLAHGLAVSYKNTVAGPHLADVRGAMRLDVTVASADGWSAYLNSSPDVAMVGGAVTATATVAVDPARATSLLAKHYAEIGTSGGSATLLVTPVVATVGTARGVPFRAGSPSPLTFALDATSMHLAPGARSSVFTPSTQSQVTREEVVPRRLAVLGLEVPIGVARMAAAAGLAVALLTLAAAAWIGRTGRGDVADEFLVKHAARILPVAAFDPGPTVIDVSDAEALHRVAERFDTLVLHHAGEDADVFAVRDVDATYRFVVPGGREARSRPPVPVPEPAPTPVPEADATAPLPLIVPAPQTSVSAGLWGRFA